MNIRHLTGRVNPLEYEKAFDKSKSSTPADQKASFKEIFQKVSDLDFSRHAIKRLENRSISMTEADINRLNEAVLKAEEKGSRDSLILDGDRAFLVNIPNKTVITAVDMMELRDRVFTNIDSTVLTSNNNN